MALALDTLRRFLDNSDQPATWDEQAETHLLKEGMLELALRQTGQKERFLQSVAREYRWRELLAELDEALAGWGCHALVFKGGAALGHLYPSSGLRPISDLDLLGEPDLPERLTRLGFRAVAEEPWIMHRGAFQLDLHQHPLGRQRFAFCWDLARAIQCSLPLSQHRGLFRFSLEDETVVALIHAGKHAYSRYIWLADIHLLLQRCCPERLGQVLREARAERYLVYAVWLLQSIRGGRLPKLKHLEKRALDLCLRRQASESLGMLLPLLSSNSFPRSARYLWHSLKPQQEASWRQRLGKLWHLVRTFRHSSNP
ncbi:MAG: nucleotidyltransferase family protein [Vulcanimicrobiota bacterium]